MQTKISNLLKNCPWWLGGKMGESVECSQPFYTKTSCSNIIETQWLKITLIE